MKIGIITLTEGNNFGNRLQNYALQKFLMNQNQEVETFRNYADININSYKIKKIIKSILYYFIDKKEYKRIKKYNEFNKKYINFSKEIISNRVSPSFLRKKYNYFICGSDQIWNSYYSENSSNNFLQFANKNQRISYAPSFGTNRISKEKEQEYRKWIEDIPNLSIREESGKKIIEKLTKRKDVEVLIDPTMLLNSEEWDKISKKPKQFDKMSNKKYIFNYFLGELSMSRKEQIAKLAKENNCQIINILDKKDSFYACGPSEFLYLEKNAFLICTDSFHSSVFAIIYNRPFVIFDREQKNVENMNSRIDTLIKKFKLRDRKYNGNSITKENLNHDYKEAYIILEKERKKSKKFLEKALAIKKK